MADAPIPSLAKAREIKISELSTYFANDDLSLDELERRIELVYRATSAADLEQITADLNEATMSRPADGRANAVSRAMSATAIDSAPSTRLVSLMSSTKRVGRWAVPRELDILAVMSDTRIDLTNAVIASGMVDLDLRAVMASLRITVPPGMRVVLDVGSFMSNVQSRADELPAEGAGGGSDPIVRLTGFAFMSDVKIIVRHREDPPSANDDDE